MKLNDNNSIEILYNKVEKESEKAMYITLPVSWNANSEKMRSFWFPKSCIEVHENTITVASFLIDRLADDNAFHGYRMHFAFVNA